MNSLTEDQVRDKANQILRFENSDNVISGVGQLTSFNTLGESLPLNPWKGNNNKPDGWYFPKDKNEPALILETKSTRKQLNDKTIDELKKNMSYTLNYYQEVLGILYNGKTLKTFCNTKPGSMTIMPLHTASKLQNKEYYLKILTDKPIDVQKIYNLTKKINDSLKFDFGIQDLYDRMIFTASALVAQRYGASLKPDYSFNAMRSTIIDALNKSLINDKQQNIKLDALVEVYEDIKMNYPENNKAVNKFINNVIQISQSINSSHWRGEDVMGIFFNEFNRYKSKSDNGQVFTPDHITNFMYRLINVHMEDSVFDGACGSGGFLTKAMANMMQESGGSSTNEAKEIKKHRLYGIEIDKRVYALAAANMMIHKDGRTNIFHGNTMSEEAQKWIRKISWKNGDKTDNLSDLQKYRITKVLMNPPYEKKYKPIDILNAVFDNVPNHTDAAVLLPDHKLEKGPKLKVQRLLKHNRLTKIIKLPKETFSEGVSVSVFIFRTGETTEKHEIFTCEIQKDGLETIKNQGRQDIKNKWPNIEEFWVKTIEKLDVTADKSCKWITPDLKNNKNLSFPIPEKPFKISEDDFMKKVMDYQMFKQKIGVKEFNENVLKEIIYHSAIIENNDEITISSQKRI